MRRVLVLLGLIAACSGTLLREAEAADDLGRALAELGSRGHVEMVDGGVGDDSGAAVKVRTVSVPGADAEMDLPGWAEVLIAPLLLQGRVRPPGSGPGSGGSGDRPPRGPAGAPRSHALLQVFLF